MWCEYCNPDPELGGKIKELPTENPNLQMITNIVTGPIYRRHGYGILQVLDCLDNLNEYKIKFCPMCGRRLGDEKEKEGK